MTFQLRSQWRVGISVLSALLMLFALVGASLAATPANQKLIRLSTDPYTGNGAQHKAELEPDIFSSGKTIVSVFQVGRYAGGGSMNIGWATSQDGGKTWKHGFLPYTTVYATPPGIYARISDPAVVYDAKYKTWMISSLAISNTDTGVLTSLSTDGGLTWGKPIIVHFSGDDKNWITCDNSPKSHFYGNCYTEWDIGVNNQHFNQVSMSTSTDGGKTWSKPANPAGTPNGIGGEPLVQPNGTVIVPILGEPTQSTADIDAFLSTNGGKTWSKYYKVSTAVSANDSNMRSGPLPTAAIDASGKVYVTWEDCRFEKGCKANDIVISSSSNGKNWSKVQRIPSDPVGSGVDHFLPGIGADISTQGKTAHLAVTYYYFPKANCNVNTCRLFVGFTSSVNGGATWSAKQQVAGPMHLSWLPQAGGYFVGDYIATAFAPGNVSFSSFAVATAPTHGLLNEDMYTTPEAIKGGSLPATSDGVVSTRSTAPIPHSAH